MEEIVDILKGIRPEIDIDSKSLADDGLLDSFDIVSLNYQLLDAKQAATPETLWLHEHCAEYGFILRYPKGKEEITEIDYESWHYRYVGVEAAAYIMEHGITLEEYLDLNN